MAAPKQWEHSCSAWGGRRWLLNVGEDCGACDVTYEQAKKLAVYPLAASGPREAPVECVDADGVHVSVGDRMKFAAREGYATSSRELVVGKVMAGLFTEAGDPSGYPYTAKNFRHAAPAQPAQQGPSVINVGDMVRVLSNAPEEFIGKCGRVLRRGTTDRPALAVAVEGSSIACYVYAEHCELVASPQPAAQQKTPGGSAQASAPALANTQRPPGPTWLTPASIPWDGLHNALLATTWMLERLSLDLTLLDNLHRGWTRGDALAERGRR